MSLEQFIYLSCGAGLLLCLLSLLLIRRRPMLGMLVFVLLLALTVSLSLLSRDLLSYRRLSDEELVAKVFVAKRDQQRFVLSLDQRDGSGVQSFMIAGDQWQLDSRVIKWKQALARLGFDNVFRLERVSGRYADIDAEQDQVRTVYRVNVSEPVDIWYWVREIEALWQWVDADYGSAVFAPLEDGAQYTVYMTYNGLSLRAENPIASKALRQWAP